MGLRVVSRATGTSTSLGLLRGRQRVRLSVTADQTVYLINDTDQEAYLVVELNRAPAGMRYQDL